MRGAQLVKRVSDQCDQGFEGGLDRGLHCVRLGFKHLEAALEDAVNELCRSYRNFRVQKGQEELEDADLAHFVELVGGGFLEHFGYGEDRMLVRLVGSDQVDNFLEASYCLGILFGAL